jgi:hypothetical protein
MDASANISPALVSAGDRIRVTGVVGQHASRKGASDGYRVWTRDRADLVRVAGVGSSPTPSTGASSPAGGSSSAPVAIGVASSRTSGTVSIVGVVTIKPTLLDASGRRIVVQDSTGAVEVLIPLGTAAPAIGARVRVNGEMARAYGAPRLRAATITSAGTGSISGLELRARPTAAHEWRLVRVRGDVLEVHRSGERWQVELLVGGARVPILGLAGAGIPSSALAEGRTATITGIVRRPYPTATDRRFAVIPRSSSDIQAGGSSDPSTNAARGATPPLASSGDRNPNTGADNGGGQIDLVTLPEHVGEVVRVGGLVAAVVADGFDLDDGTSVERVTVRGDARPVLASIGEGAAIGVVGRAERTADQSVVVAVEDPAAIHLIGDPTAGTPPAASAFDTMPSAVAATAAHAAALGDSAVPQVGAAGLVLIGIASLAVTLLRRRRLRQRFTSRLSARLDELVGAAGNRTPGGAAFGAPALAASRPSAVTGPTGLARGNPEGGAVGGELGDATAASAGGGTADGHPRGVL